MVVDIGQCCIGVSGGTWNPLKIVDCVPQTQYVPESITPYSRVVLDTHTLRGQWDIEYYSILNYIIVFNGGAKLDTCTHVISLFLKYYSILRLKYIFITEYYSILKFNIIVSLITNPCYSPLLPRTKKIPNQGLLGKVDMG